MLVVNRHTWEQNTCTQEINLKQQTWTGEMTQQAKVLAAAGEDMQSHISEIHGKVGGGVGTDAFNVLSQLCACSH